MPKVRSVEKDSLLRKQNVSHGNYNTVAECESSSEKRVYIADVVSASEKRREHEVKVLFGALIFCFCFMIVEFFCGILAHSLALLTDAAHLFVDVGSYGLSIMSLKASSKSLCGKYNYGWHRAEVIGTLISVFSIWALVVWIVIESITRIFNVVACSQVKGNVGKLSGGNDEALVLSNNLICKKIDSPLILIIGALGILVNVVCASILHFGGSHGHSHFGSHGHSHSNDMTTDVEDDIDVVDVDIYDKHNHSHDKDGHSHNEGKENKKKSRGFAVHAALLHALGDLVQSIGVIIAGMFIFFANKYMFGVSSFRYSIYNIADPICSLFFGVITLYMTKPLLGELLGILMESTPPGVDYTALQNQLLKINGVVSVHDLHVWSLSSDYVALSVHLVADDAEETLRMAERLCRDMFGISHTTIQVDKVENGAELCHAVCFNSE